MKSKYYLSLFLIGVLPILVLAGVYFGTLLTKPAPKAPPPLGAEAGRAALAPLQARIQTLASSIGANVLKTHGDVSSLFAKNSQAELEDFVRSHPGVRGAAILSLSGRLERGAPSAGQVVGPAYGASEEFRNITAKLKSNGGKPYLFFTRNFGDPSIVFAAPAEGNGVAVAVFGFSNFFRDLDLKGGEAFLLESKGGSFFYHSDPGKLGGNFNPGGEAWLSKIQADLQQKQASSIFNPGGTSAVWAHADFATCGIVHLLPSSSLQPAAAAPAQEGPSFDDPAGLFMTPMSLAALLALGWVLIMGSVFFGLILKPLKGASEAIRGAAEGTSNLGPETVRRFGDDEVGKIVQAASALMGKAAEERQKAAQESEEMMRKGKAQIDERMKAADAQAAEAQRQVQSIRGELNDKNQMLNDKLKELDALKGMSEGLRNQSEQAKTENAKLRSQIDAAAEAQGELKGQVLETQKRLVEMESKMLQTVAASSAIQVSEVRAAAIRTMSDELKTTLGIIKGYVSSALGTTQGGISEKQQEFLGMVINRSARLEKFINDLLDIYQVETEIADAKHEEVNLASEIEALAFNFQAQAEVKNIKLKVESKPNLPKVPIVRRRFTQMWNILYLQIIKDAPRGSSITFTVEPIGDSIKVTAPDPGLTVATEALPKLFDQFYDPKHPASPQLAGTGLKFALLKTILAAHGGGAVAEKTDPGTKLILTFSTKIKKPGTASPIPASPSLTAPGLKPSPGIGKPTLGPTAPPKPPLSIGMPKPAAPGAPAAPGIGKPMAPGAAPGAPIAPAGAPPPPPPGAPPTGPKPAPMSGGGLDALFSGKIPSVDAPGLKPGPMVPGAPPAPAPGAPPIAPKPPVPGAPPVPGIPGALKPPSLGGPGPSIPPSPPTGAPKPPMPPPGLLDSLLEKKPAPAPGAPPAPGPGAPPMGAPNPSSASGPRPPMPGVPPAGGPPGAPAAPKVVPTSVKPSTPPPGILDLDNMDSFKTDAGKPAPPPPGLSAPAPGAPGAPKPPLPPPGAPPAGKPIVKDLNKEGEGELIE